MELGIRTGRKPWLACLLIISLALAAEVHADEARAAYSYASPLHPDQCAQAIEAARLGRFARAPESVTDLLLADGHLCLGLLGDSASLHKAADLYRCVLDDSPEDFFALLGFADAIRKLHPSSAEAEHALVRVQALFSIQDLGPGREALERYVGRNLAAVRLSRENNQRILDNLATSSNPSEEDNAERESILLAMGTGEASSGVGRLSQPIGPEEGRRITSEGRPRTGDWTHPAFPSLSTDAELLAATGGGTQ